MLHRMCSEWLGTLSMPLHYFRQSFATRVFWKVPLYTHRFCLLELITLNCAGGVAGSQKDESSGANCTRMSCHGPCRCTQKDENWYATLIRMYQCPVPGKPWSHNRDMILQCLQASALSLLLVSRCIATY